MSSSLRRSRPDRRSAARTAAAVLAVIVVTLATGATGAVGSPGDFGVLAIDMSKGSEVSLVVAVPPEVTGSTLPAGSLSVHADGAPLPSRVDRVASSGLSVALVVDTGGSPGAAEGLAAATSGAAGFVFGLPGGSRTVVISAGATPRVVAPGSSDPTVALRGLAALRADGPSSSAAALTLAAEQLAGLPPGPRVIVLYAAGQPDGAADSRAVAARLASAGAILFVVGTGAGGGGWSSVATSTGGSALTTTSSDVATSYDRVAASVRRLYLVRFRLPQPSPRRTVLQLDAGTVRTSTTVLVDAGGARRSVAGLPVIAVAAAVVALLLAVCLFVAVWSRRRRTPVYTPHPGAGAMIHE